MSIIKKASQHTWNFFRSGGLDQVKLTSGKDLSMIDQLDKKLWVALSCPTKDLNFDSKTLEYIDSDHDGRIRASELIDAVRWVCTQLKNPDELLHGKDILSVDSLHEPTAQNQSLKPSIKLLLQTQGKPDLTHISVSDSEMALKQFYNAPFNGDGIITQDSTEDPALKATIADILTCTKPETDKSGKPGITKDIIEEFFTQVQAFVLWQNELENDPSLAPTGSMTAQTWSSLQAVRTKIDDYFTRCKLAAFDVRSADMLNRDEKDYANFASKVLTIHDADIVNLPISHIQAGKPIDLLTHTNPAWSHALEVFHRDTVCPLLGKKETLSEDEWNSLIKSMEPYSRWLEKKCGSTVEKLGINRLRELLKGDAQQKLLEAIAKDLDQQPFAASIIEIDKLLHYYRDIYTLCINFVNFKAFYSPQKKAMFQSGTLYIDQRSCDLCLILSDAAKHASIAALAGTCLVYCQCQRKASAEKIQIVAAITDGDSENLMIGRNGLFYDYKGIEWDATVTKIIENPISIRQAFWSPYKNFVRMIETQIAKRASAAESSATSKLENAASATVSVDKTKSAEQKKLDVGSVAALGVAFGALGTFVATVMGYMAGIVKLGPVAIAGALVGLILLISCPSMILAYIKLRKRNLGPILDGNDWAINARAKITVPLGASLTHIPKLPSGSRRDLFDPFAEKKSIWPKLLVVGLLLYLLYLGLNYTGILYSYSGGRFGIDKQFSFEKYFPHSDDSSQE